MWPQLSLCDGQSPQHLSLPGRLLWEPPGAPAGLCQGVHLQVPVRLPGRHRLQHQHQREEELCGPLQGHELRQLRAVRGEEQQALLPVQPEPHQEPDHQQVRDRLSSLLQD